jgi:hypothetical protein
MDHQKYKNHYTLQAEKMKVFLKAAVKLEENNINHVFDFEPHSPVYQLQLIILIFNLDK